MKFQLDPYYDGQKDKIVSPEVLEHGSFNVSNLRINPSGIQ